MRGSTTGANRRSKGVKNELLDFAAPGNCWVSIMGLVYLRQQKLQ
jgi:hypothetical protein